jgi:hypothetical protein
LYAALRAVVEEDDDGVEVESWRAALRSLFFLGFFSFTLARSVFLPSCPNADCGKLAHNPHNKHKNATEASGFESLNRRESANRRKSLNRRKNASRRNISSRCLRLSKATPKETRMLKVFTIQGFTASLPILLAFRP